MFPLAFLSLWQRRAVADLQHAMFLTEVSVTPPASPLTSVFAMSLLRSSSRLNEPSSLSRSHTSFPALSQIAGHAPAPPCPFQSEGGYTWESMWDITGAPCGA